MTSNRKCFLKEIFKSKLFDGKIQYEKLDPQESVSKKTEFFSKNSDFTFVYAAENSQGFWISLCKNVRCHSSTLLACWSYMERGDEFHRNFFLKEGFITFLKLPFRGVGLTNLSQNIFPISHSRRKRMWGLKAFLWRNKFLFLRINPICISGTKAAYQVSVRTNKNLICSCEQKSVA